MGEKIEVSENYKETEEAENQCHLQLQLSYLIKRNGKPPEQGTKLLGAA